MPLLGFSTTQTSSITIPCLSFLKCIQTLHRKSWELALSHGPSKKHRSTSTWRAVPLLLHWAPLSLDAKCDHDIYVHCMWCTQNYMYRASHWVVVPLNRQDYCGTRQTTQSIIYCLMYIITLITAASVWPNVEVPRDDIMRSFSANWSSLGTLTSFCKNPTLS